MVIFFIPFFHPSMHSMGKSWRVADQNLWQIFSSLFASCDGIIQHTTLWKHYQDDSASQSVESGKVLFTLVKHPHLKLGRFIFVLVLYLCRYRFFFASPFHLFTFRLHSLSFVPYILAIIIPYILNKQPICLRFVYFTLVAEQICVLLLSALLVSLLFYHSMSWHGMAWYTM